MNKRPDMCVVRGLWRRRYRVPSMSGRLTSGGTIGEENLSDASGLFQSGEVSGVGEGDRFGAGKQGEVGDPVGSAGLLRTSSQRQHNGATQNADKISSSHLGSKKSGGGYPIQ